MKITLIGYMGCGKTSIGKILANKLNARFYDLDDLIMQDQNNSIINIFKKKGENYFRNQENLILKKFFQKKIKKYVLSVGGGTPCFYNNIYLINKFSKTIYLKMNSYSLLTRLILEKKNRPLISKLDKNNLFKFIVNNLSKRTFFYEKSQEKINVSKKSKNDIVQEIMNKILI